MSKRIGRTAFCIPSDIHDSAGGVLEWERAGEGWAGKQRGWNLVRVAGLGVWRSTDKQDK